MSTMSKEYHQKYMKEKRISFYVSCFVPNEEKKNVMSMAVRVACSLAKKTQGQWIKSLIENSSEYKEALKIISKQ